jgi:glucosamine-6-phosphate deaminase
METKVNNINVKTVPREWDVYFDLALAMLEEIMKNNAAGKKTVMIVPVGPTDQYPILARLVNQLRVSLKDVWFFNMDEYMWSESKMIEKDHVMSFERRMNDEFYSRVDEALVMPKEQRLFPCVGKEAEYDALIEKLGGVDACFGGLGINGHLAFNEPFSSLVSRTRIKSLTYDTIVVNSRFFDGDISKVPTTALTVGVGTVMDAKEVLVLAFGHKKANALREAIEGAYSQKCTLSALQAHPHGIIVADELAVGELKVNTYRYFKDIEKDNIL